MAASAVPVSTTYELLSTQFKAPEFIQFTGPLNERTVIDYFANSPFYDKQCTNQMIRMQNIANFTSQIGRWTAAEEEEQLKKFQGTEYVLANSHPPSLFVIHRRERSSETETRVVAAYYIINDAVMQAPDVYQVIGNRLSTALNAITNSLSLARSAQPPLDLRSSVSGGRAWKVYQEPEPDIVATQQRGNGSAVAAAATSGSSAFDAENAAAAAVAVDDLDAPMAEPDSFGATGKVLLDASLKRQQAPLAATKDSSKRQRGSE